MDKNNQSTPENPLEFIQECIRERWVLWTYHVNMRLRERTLSRQLILDAVESFEIIESYPEDKYLPSYLVYGRHQERDIHVLFAVDMEGRNVRVVTAYHPDPGYWEADGKSRRKQ